jgi:hypothetical protein
MKYDDSEYFFLNFETDLDNHAANTHIGMYLAWAVHAGLARVDPADEAWTRAVAATQARQLTGANLLSRRCDGKLTEVEFNDEGNAFTSAYYADSYGKDYARVFDSQIPSTGHHADDICSVPDTWVNFDLLKPVLDTRLMHWRAGRQGGGANHGASPAPDVDALRRRAEAGDAEAWHDLAAEYLTGAHVPQDLAKAADAFEKAAQAGLPAAAFNLGVCYQNGDGRPQDAQQRLRWFALAAEGGHGRATYFLALAHLNGSEVPKDLVAYNALMLLAQQRGVEEAISAAKGGSMEVVNESVALAQQLEQPGRLVAVLAARRRRTAAGLSDSGLAHRKPSPPPAADAQAVERGNAGDVESEVPAREPRRFGLGHVALLIGATGAVLLLLSITMARRFDMLPWVLSIVGAAGAFAVGPSLGLKGAARIVVTALAAVPPIGSFVNLWLLMRWIGRRSD